MPAHDWTRVESGIFLEPRAHVQVPLEATYQTAFSFVPKRWRQVLDAPAA